VINNYRPVGYLTPQLCLHEVGRSRSGEEQVDRDTVGSDAIRPIRSTRNTATSRLRARVAGRRVDGHVGALLRKLVHVPPERRRPVFEPTRLPLLLPRLHRTARSMMECMDEGVSERGNAELVRRYLDVVTGAPFIPVPPMRSRSR
jgi:hypothetical protein